MHTHPNARLTPIGRERLIRQHLEEGRSLAQLAADHGISERTARKWLARFRSGGPAALADRRSVRRTQRRTLDPQQLQRAVELRHQRCTLRRIARLLLVPISTLARAMRRLGLNRLRNLDPKPPVQRYQWEQPGDMIHVDIKQLARFERVGHRITGDPRKGSSPEPATRRSTWRWMTPPACPTSRCLPDEKGPTAVGFLSRAVAWFNGQGIECRRVLSDNGVRLQVPWLAKSLPGHGIEAEEDQALHPSNQRQGRAVHQNPAGGVGLRDALRQLGRQERAVAGLPADL